MAGHIGGGRGVSSKPMNVEQIVKEAQNFDYNPHIPLKYWLRSAGTLLKEAEIYEHEGNEQQTYLLLFRHAQLVLKNLSAHPDARSPSCHGPLGQAEREVERSLAKMESLKPRINKKYERYEKHLKERAALGIPGSDRHAQPDSFDDSRSPKRLRRQPMDPAVAGTEALAASDNKDLAVRLARKEIKRRALARKATRQAGIPEEVEQERRTAGVWGNWEEAFTNDDPAVDKESLSRQMQNVRIQVDGKRSNPIQNGDSRLSVVGSRLSYKYPAISPSKGVHQNGTAEPVIPRTEPPARGLVELLKSPGLSQPSRPPPPPPKDDLDVSGPPPRPEKQPLAELESPVSASPDTTTPASQPDITPSGYTFKPSAYLENGSPLRTIFLPPDLRHRFLSLAEPNTRANLETCGILCGTLISNALFISKLVIPEQKSTSDTCETVNENLLFDYVDGEDLMMLGWIHTHPTQTCFMSSRDLHTHFGYQVMMPESIAIVCAPSKNDWGVFRLTDPPGMKCIVNCSQTGLFHPHAESNIYTDALRPGHVFEAGGLEFDVYDMRTKD